MGEVNIFQTGQVGCWVLADSSSSGNLLIKGVCGAGAIVPGTAWHYFISRTRKQARVRKRSALAKVTALMESGIKACSDPETWGSPHTHTVPPGSGWRLS